MRIPKEAEVWKDKKSKHHTIKRTKHKFKLCYDVKKFKEQNLVALFGEFFFIFVRFNGCLENPNKGWRYCIDTDIENIKISTRKLKKYGVIGLFADVFECQECLINISKWIYCYQIKKSKFDELKEYIKLNEKMDKIYYDFKSCEVQNVLSSLDDTFDINKY